MKIGSLNSSAGTLSAKGNGGSDALSFFGVGVAGEQKSFSAHMLALRSQRNTRDGNRECGPERDETRHDEATDCVRSSAELVAMTSAQPLERHEAPGGDVSKQELNEDLPPVQSSAQLATQSFEQNASLTGETVSVGDLAESLLNSNAGFSASAPAESDPTATTAQSFEQNASLTGETVSVGDLAESLLRDNAALSASAPAESDPTATTDSEFPQIPITGETAAELAQSSETPELPKDSTAVTPGTVNLAAGETAAQKAAPEKTADHAGNADKHRLRSLAEALGTHSAKPQRSMTDDPKSTLPEPSSTPSGEDAARPNVMTRSEGESMQDQGEKHGFSDQGPRAESNQGFRVDHANTPEVRTFEASQPLPPVHAPAMQVVTTSSRGFESVFKALGEVVEKMRVQGPNKVEMELQLDSGEKLLVRLEMRQGTVHAAFRSETGGFQQALQQGWSQFAQQSSERGVHVADAKFEMNSSDSQASLNQQSSRDRAHDGAGTQQHAPRVFSSSTRQGAQQTTTLKANQGTQGDNSGISLWA